MLPGRTSTERSQNADVSLTTLEATATNMLCMTSAQRTGVTSPQTWQRVARGREAVASGLDQLVRKRSAPLPTGTTTPSDCSAPRNTAPLPTREIVAAGHLGRKSGRGFDNFEGAKQMDLSAPPASAPPVPAAGNDIDRKIRSELGRATGSLSVASALLAAGDWGVNLLVSPGKRMELGLLALEYAGQVARYDFECWLAGPGERAASSSRRHATAVSTATHGCTGRSTCSISRSCSRSNGGQRPRGGYAESNAITRSWCRSPRANGSTWRRPETC